MALDSTSTLADVRAAYRDNSSYAENGSASECKAFIQACRILLEMLPATSAAGGHNVAINHEVIQAQLRTAETWYVSQLHAQIVHPDFRDFRS